LFERRAQRVLSESPEKILVLELGDPTEGLLFFSFLYRQDLYTQPELQTRAEQLYGKALIFAPTVNPLKSYYAKEMGAEEELNRFFMVPSNSFPREFLLTTKLLSLEWEREWACDSARMVNVDVGMITAENFLLATTKSYSHRVYLGQRIFADLTYEFKNGQFETLPWTYPDYRDDEKIQFLAWCRSFLLSRAATRG